MQLKQIVGANVRSVRGDLTRRAFGAALGGVDPLLIYRWERGDHRPSDPNLAALASFANREIAWFYVDHREQVAA